ncbi:hypothetical protein LguiA_029469 [Lonicera macranthoides]
MHKTGSSLELILERIQRMDDWLEDPLPLSVRLGLPPGASLAKVVDPSLDRDQWDQHVLGAKGYDVLALVSVLNPSAPSHSSHIDIPQLLQSSVSLLNLSSPKTQLRPSPCHSCATPLLYV